LSFWVIHTSSRHRWIRNHVGEQNMISTEMEEIWRKMILSLETEI
jgi:hypothetical protein